jgi:hypothetical protein|tara:strand:+ start:605 stop:754 length:150 start_codon:yes stop_codon:yes gene_type:complete
MICSECWDNVHHKEDSYIILGNGEALHLNCYVKIDRSKPYGRINIVPNE